MIIIKTNNGMHFVNEKEVQVVRLQNKLRDFGCEL
jgi:hypothetical protein